MSQSCPVVGCEGYLERENFLDGYTDRCFACEFFHHGPPEVSDEIASENTCPMCSTQLEDLHCSNCNVTYDLDKDLEECD